MKSTTSCSFIYTAPCAADSSSTSTGSCTPYSYSSNLPELLVNGRKDRFYNESFMKKPHRFAGAVGRGNAHGMVCSAIMLQHHGSLDGWTRMKNQNSHYGGGS